MITAKHSWLGALLSHSVCFQLVTLNTLRFPLWTLTCCLPTISPLLIYLFTYLLTDLLFIISSAGEIRMIIFRACPTGSVLFGLSHACCILGSVCRSPSNDGQHRFWANSLSNAVTCLTKMQKGLPLNYSCRVSICGQERGLSWKPCKVWSCADVFVNLFLETVSSLWLRKTSMLLTTALETAKESWSLVLRCLDVPLLF